MDISPASGVNQVTASLKAQAEETAAMLYASQHSEFMLQFQAVKGALQKSALSTALSSVS
jgi:hypothetical protein